MFIFIGVNLVSRVSKFLENELDRVSTYLSMAQANLLVTQELTENRCEKITNNLDFIDEKIIDYLNNFELSKLSSRIEDAREIIDNFKKFTLELEDKNVYIENK